MKKPNPLYKYLWYSKHNAPHIINCFGCFITITDEWCKYVDMLSYFYEDGKSVKTNKTTT